MTPEDECERNRAAILQDACSIGAKHYEDYWNAFVNLDTKASVIATIGGIVLAAVVAFLEGGQVPAVAQGNWMYRALIIASPVLALVAVVMSLFSSLVMDVMEPFDAPERIREAKNLAELDCSEFSLRHSVNYYQSQATYWSEAIGDIKDVVAKKAHRVLCAQCVLILALAALVVLFVVLVWAPKPKQAGAAGSSFVQSNTSEGFGYPLTSG